MSSDETIVLALSVLVAGFLLVRWYWLLGARRSLRRASGGRLWLALAPVACIVGLLSALNAAAAQDVRGVPAYLALYTVLGAAWVMTAVSALRFFGVSFRDDAVERRNPAAIVFLIAAMIGLTIVFAGANIGDGPGWWVVIATALLGTGAWFLAYAVVEIGAGANEAIVVERDAAAAIRLGGYAVASGLVCARMAAGDWISLEHLLAEARIAWPLIPLAAGAILMERMGRMRSGGGTAILVAAAYIAAALFYINTSAPLSHNPIYDAPY